jgi:hypothetical protein
MNKFQELILPYIRQSEFGKYILDRPRGYVGDFVSQEMIWNARTNGIDSKLRGESEIGKVLNLLTMEMDNPKANEERIYILRDIIKQSGENIASIGCGCAIELWNIDSNNLKDIFLLDFDEGAINRSKEKIVLGSDTQIKFHQDNVLKFILRQDDNTIGKRNLVYVFGLCDYFSLKHTKRIVEGLWKFVESDGLLVITNAIPENRTRFWMEYGGNWFLDYKSENEMYSLVEGLRSVKKAELKIDSYNVYQYLMIKKD